jgi:septum formation inhibitor MinC
MSYAHIGKSAVFLIICLFLLSASSMQRKNTAQIKFLIGEAEILSKGQTEWRAAKFNMEIKSGDRIKTLLNARVEINMPDGTVIKVNENSIFDIKEIKTVEQDKEDKMSFTLWAGNIWAKFKKVVNTRQVRTIDSPSAVVAIRGTILDVNVDNNQSTKVRVFEGSVSVMSTDAQGEVIVGTNQETTVDKGKAPTSPETIQDSGESEENAGSRLPVTGRVAPGARVTADGKPLVVGPNGIFNGRVAVQEGLNNILFEAQLGQRKKSSNLRLFVNTRKPQINLSTPIVAGFLNRRDYSLSGAIFDLTPRDKVKVYLNDDMVAEVEGRGSFNRTIILNEGRNDIRISAVDLSGNRIEIAEQLFLDTVKPIITVTEPAQPVLNRFEPPRPPQRDNQQVTDLSSVDAERFKQVIRGLIIDPEPSSKIKRISVNGQEIKVNSDGTFETGIALRRGENRLSFYVEDMAGNITQDNSRVIWVR